jgi:hypothetical protein
MASRTSLLAQVKACPKSHCVRDVIAIWSTPHLAVGPVQTPKCVLFSDLEDVNVSEIVFRWVGESQRLRFVASVPFSDNRRHFFQGFSRAGRGSHNYFSQRIRSNYVYYFGKCVPSALASGVQMFNEAAFKRLADSGESLATVRAVVLRLSDRWTMLAITMGTAWRTYRALCSPTQDKNWHQVAQLVPLTCRGQHRNTFLDR